MANSSSPEEIRAEVTPGAPEGPILELVDAHVGYGAIRAVQGVSLSVPLGRCVAVIGANGAGKSTLAKAIAGLVPLARGEVRYQGRPLGRTPAFRRARAGLVLCPERRRLFPDFTVAENLAIGTPRGAEGPQALVYQLFPILEARARQRAGTLSGGEQQMLAIGRALMSQPKLFVLDEPTLGLAPLIRRSVFATLQSIKARACTVLIMEQNATETLRIADYAYVLSAGRVVWQGRPSTDMSGASKSVRDLHYAPASHAAEAEGETD